MTTDAMLAEIARMAPKDALEALDGMIWGQSVDPCWPQEDMDKVRHARMRVLNELDRNQPRRR